MKKLVGIVMLSCLAATAFAQGQQAPQVTAPENGSRIGPNVDVMGRTEGKHFVVIITDVYVAGMDKPLRSVPGHRHWTDDEGNFCLRISTPRVINAKDSDLIYKIRVFVHDPGCEKGPETVVTCYAK